MQRDTSKSLFIYWLVHAFVLLTWNSVAQSGQPVPGFDNLDTIKLRVNTFEAMAPERLLGSPDTSLSNDFLQYDLVRKGSKDKGHLGNIGSPHFDLIFDPHHYTGLDLGFHQFDLYRKRASNLIYYKTNAPYSNVAYTQGEDQNDGQLTADFATNFASGFAVHIDYDRIFYTNDVRPILSSGQFEPVKLKHTNVGVGVSHISKNGNYKAFFAFALNTSKVQDTGGFESEDQILYGNAENYSIGVNLNEALTRNELNDLVFTHHFNIPVDSTGNSFFNLTHRIAYENERYKFSDSNTNDSGNFSNDSAFYKTFLTDSRGIRHFLHDKRISNTVYLSFIDRGKVERAYPNAFRVGIKHQYDRIDLERKDTTINSLVLLGHWNRRLTPSIELNASADLHVGDLSGDLSVVGSLDIALPGKWGNIQGDVLVERRSPALIYNQLTINNILFWSNDFEKETKTMISASYRYRNNFGISVKQYLLDQILYFDQVALPNQKEGIESVNQLQLYANLKWKFLHLDNIFTYQTSPAELLPLPEIFTKHSFYIEGKVFKKRLHVRVGMDIRYFSEFAAPAYQPLLGNFFNQNLYQIGGGLIWDSYVSFKIDTFRFFARMDNMQPFFTEEVYYNSPLHPIWDKYMRIGFSWQLKG